jgi:hypothetical protein
LPSHPGSSEQQHPVPSTLVIEIVTFILTLEHDGIQQAGAAFGETPVDVRLVSSDSEGLGKVRATTRSASFANLANHAGFALIMGNGRGSHPLLVT